MRAGFHYSFQVLTLTVTELMVSLLPGFFTLTVPAFIEHDGFFSQQETQMLAIQQERCSLITSTKLIQTLLVFGKLELY